MDGLVLIDKPSGISSFKVVSIVRRKLSASLGKKVKVGHTGTLDPFATGLMILVVGSYCKRANEFSKLDKTYEATIELGQTSTTGDPEGELFNVSDVVPTIEQVKDALGHFLGVISQRPPKYSAIKINGQRAYKLAREGKEVILPNREVTITKLNLTEYQYPSVKLEASVSSGTYIRSLAEAIGEALGVGAYTKELRRTRVGKYTIEMSQGLDQPVKLEQI